MTKAEALELACASARQRGYDPEQYDIQTTEEGLRWVVNFHRESAQVKPQPGDFFTVYVDSRSKAVERFIPGK